MRFNSDVLANIIMLAIVVPSLLLGAYALFFADISQDVWIFAFMISVGACFAGSLLSSVLYDDYEGLKKVAFALSIITIIVFAVFMMTDVYKNRFPFVSELIGNMRWYSSIAALVLVPLALIILFRILWALADILWYDAEDIGWGIFRLLIVLALLFFISIRPALNTKTVIEEGRAAVAEIAERSGSLNLEVDARNVTFARKSPSYYYITPGNELKMRSSRGSTLSDGDEWVTVDSNVRSIEATGSTVFYIKTDNALWGYGSNENGRLGDGTGTDREQPVMILDDVARLYAEDNTVYVLKNDGSLWKWGRAGSNRNDYAPVCIVDGGVAALLSNLHQPYVYRNLHRQNGLVEGIPPNYGAGIFPVYSFQGAFGGNLFSENPAESGLAGYFVDEDRTLWYASFDSSRSLACTTSWLENRQELDQDVKDFYYSTQTNNRLVIRTDNSLWGSGGNGYGELGDGTKVPCDEPVRIASNVASARFYSYLTLNGELWTWTSDNPTPAMAASGVGNPDTIDMLLLNNGTWVVDYNRWSGADDATRERYEIRGVKVP